MFLNNKDLESRSRNLYLGREDSLSISIKLINSRLVDIIPWIPMLFI